MLHNIEKSAYSSVIAASDHRWKGELFAGQIGYFVSRGGFEYSQVASRPVLHLVRRGRGVFQCAAGDFEAGEGAVFCFWPGEYYHYHDFPESPWEYYWVQFAGDRAAELVEKAGYSAGRPYLPGRSWQVMAALEYWHRELAESGRPEAACAAAWDILYRAGSGDAAAEPLAVRVRRQIDNALYTWPTVQELADDFGVSRSHLFRCFRDYYGLGVRDYLARRRLQRACELLEFSGTPLEVIARQCAYCDRQHFVRVFRRALGVAPGQWRSGKQRPG